MKAHAAEQIIQHPGVHQGTYQCFNVGFVLHDYEVQYPV